MLALDLPPMAAKHSLTMRAPVQDPEKILKCKALLHLQPATSFVKPNRNLTKIVNQLSDKILKDCLSLEKRFAISELELLVKNLVKVITSYHHLQPEHLGAEYTNDDSILFYVSKEDIDVQTEVFLDFEENSVFTVNNVFQNDELILNYSTEGVEKSIEKISNLIPKSQLDYFNIVEYHR